MQLIKRSQLSVAFVHILLLFIELLFLLHLRPESPKHVLVNLRSPFFFLDAQRVLREGDIGVS